MRNGGLVKTVEFKEGKYVGDPINAVKIFNEKESDELFVVDIDASTNGVEPNFRLIGQLAVECRMPLCYGGGIKTVEQARRIIGLGVEKVALSSAVLANSRLIAEIGQAVGCQSVVVVLDAKKGRFGSAYEVWTHNARRTTGKTVVEAAQEAERFGAGEIVVNSIDNDGRMGGYDLMLAKMVRDATTIPLTILGGAASLDDIRQLISTCGVVGAAAGSLFVFKGPYRAVLINYPNSAQREELIRGALTH